jgi:acetoacetate decarboxylase
MIYPPAPWSLFGSGVFTLHRVEIDRARPFVPPQLQIVPILPGKTLGVLLLIQYGPGSVLEYHELIVVPALVRFGWRVGIWVSHIYVDHPESVAGGREIWGLPKELAEFAWDLETKGAVSVRQGDRTLCVLQGGQPRLMAPIPMFLPAISLLDGSVLRFNSRFRCRLGPSRGRVEAPPATPFAPFDLTQSSLIYHLQDVRLVVGAPQELGKMHL